jgi:hypothetical protein
MAGGAGLLDFGLADIALSWPSMAVQHIATNMPTIVPRRMLFIGPPLAQEFMRQEFYTK